MATSCSYDGHMLLNSWQHAPHIMATHAAQMIAVFGDFGIMGLSPVSSSRWCHIANRLVLPGDDSLDCGLPLAGDADALFAGEKPGEPGKPGAPPSLGILLNVDRVAGAVVVEPLPLLVAAVDAAALPLLRGPPAVTDPPLVVVDGEPAPPALATESRCEAGAATAPCCDVDDCAAPADDTRRPRLLPGELTRSADADAGAGATAGSSPPAAAAAADDGATATDDAGADAGSDDAPSSPLASADTELRLASPLVAAVAIEIVSAAPPLGPASTFGEGFGVLRSTGIFFCVAGDEPSAGEPD